MDRVREVSTGRKLKIKIIIGDDGYWHLDDYTPFHDMAIGHGHPKFTFKDGVLIFVPDTKDTVLGNAVFCG